MDSARLMRAGFALMSLVVASLTHAAAPVSGWSVAYGGKQTSYGTTKDAACAGLYSQFASSGLATSYYVYNQFDNPQLPRCRVMNGTTSQADATVTPTNVCPDGSQVPAGGVCPDPAPTCTAGKRYETSISDPGPGSVNGPLPSNVGGCAVKPTKVVRCASYVEAGATKYFCTYEVEETGQVAPSGSPPSQTVTPPTTGTTPTTVPPKVGSPGSGCPEGTVQTGMDSAGTAICAGSGTSPTKPTTTTTTKPSTTTTAPDGSTVKTDVTETVNSDGSTTTTTTTTTTAPNGAVTVTSSSITGSRPGGGSGTSDEQKDDFCGKHPELNICRNSTVSGSCENISCQGDAIQCTIARQVAKENCDRKTAEDAIKASAAFVLGEKLLAGNDPEAANLPSPDKAQVINLPTSLNQAGWLGGGACFPDKTFAIGSYTATIPFSQACQYLVAFRYLVMLMAALACFRILSAAVFK